MNIKQIKFKQPKYIFPLVLYPILVYTGYFIISLFFTKPLEAKSDLETTTYFNDKLPDASYRGDGIGNKVANMRSQWGNITDYSAISDLDQDSIAPEEEYESRYTDEDLLLLAEAEAEREADLKRMKELQDQLMALNTPEFDGDTPQDTYESMLQKQREEREALERALAQAVSMEETDTTPTTTVTVTATAQTNTPPATADAVSEIAEEATPGVVVKVQPERSSYFSTITDPAPKSKLIKAIIDEDIKCVDGSRVRLRLLDDINVSGAIIPKGTCIYATVSGFGSQRIRFQLQSLMVDDALYKVNLRAYDTDGQEGLYIPKSQFRETMKNIASGAMNTSQLMSTTTGEDNFSRWGMQSLRNAVSQAGQALSQNIRQNTAKLKYGTFVYLVNGQDAK